METSAVLNKAADLIEKRGWVQASAGMLVNGPHCAQGAIQAARGDVQTVRDYKGRGDRYVYLDLAPCPAGDALLSYLGRLTLQDIWRWNDSLQRTAAEVIEVLRACAVIEAAREEQDAVWETYAEVVTA